MAKNLLSTTFLLLSVLAIPALAQGPRTMVTPIPCLPAAGNGVATAVVQPDATGGEEVRLYFRREGYGDFYYVVMEGDEPGRHWGVFPVPEEGNHVAEYYAAVVRPGGRVLAQSPVQTVGVSRECGAVLSAEQSRRAASLAIGETSLSQKHRKVAWWECVGVTERIDVLGEHREDASCERVAWWERPELLVPLGLAGAGITSVGIVDDQPPGGPELSPVIP